MGDEVKDEKEIKKKKRVNISVEQRRGRQINFFIMRHMWQVIRGRSGRQEYDTIHANFDMSRARFEKFIKGKNIRWKVIDKQTGGKFQELDWLEYTTGISRGIFNGVTLFQIKNVTDEDWTLFCQSLKDEGLAEEKSEMNQSNGDAPVLETPTALRKRIIKAIEAQDKKDSNNYQFYNLCYYLRERNPNRAPKENITLKNVAAALKSIKIETLENADLETLKRFVPLLKNTYEKARTIREYRSLVRKI